MEDLENTDQMVYGMLPAGAEEVIVAKLKRQGSLTIPKEEQSNDNEWTFVSVILNWNVQFPFVDLLSLAKIFLPACLFLHNSSTSHPQ